MLEIDSTTHRARAQRARPAGNNPPNAIVFHSGEGNRDDDIDFLTHSTSASAHYYVLRTGKIFQFVDDARRASHAGPTFYLNQKNWNDFSIGIETEHRKGQSWPEAQLDAISELLKHLVVKHGIIRERLTAHRWVRFPESDEHQDPTNFPDPKLHAFFARLYPAASRGTLMRVTEPDARVRDTPGTEIPTDRRLNRGDIIEIERIVEGQPVSGNPRWARRMHGLGFIHTSLLASVKADDTP